MSIRSALIAVTTLMVIPTGLHAAAITVWEHANFRGDSQVFDSTVADLRQLGWNDRISSVRVDSGQWELCRHVDYEGCRTLSTGNASIANLEGGWNDAISSLRPLGATPAAAVGMSAEDTARRLYLALLGREADPNGLRNATEMIQAGKLEELVRSLTQSDEYRRLRTERGANELLDQIHRGLLGHPADDDARAEYLADIQRGREHEVVLAILSSDEWSSGGARVRSATAGMSDIELEADGEGIVYWGSRGRHENVNEATVKLNRNGTASIELQGRSPQTLTGTWSPHQQQGEVRLSMNLTMPDGGREQGQGILSYVGDRLQRFHLTSGRPETRDRAVVSFVAEGYKPSREEAACQEAVRGHLEDKVGRPVTVMFLAPERSPEPNRNEELNGEALILSENRVALYSCRVDPGRGELLTANARLP